MLIYLVRQVGGILQIIYYFEYILRFVRCKKGECKMELSLRNPAMRNSTKRQYRGDCDDDDDDQGVDSTSSSMRNDNPEALILIRYLLKLLMDIDKHFDTFSIILMNGKSLTVPIVKNVTKIDDKISIMIRPINNIDFSLSIHAGSQQEIMDFVKKADNYSLTGHDYPVIITPCMRIPNLMFNRNANLLSMYFTIERFEADSIAIPLALQSDAYKEVISRAMKFHNYCGRTYTDGDIYPKKLGMLLHGPPGTGKTSIIKQIAKLTGRSIVNFVPHMTRSSDVERIIRLMVDPKVSHFDYTKLIFVIEEADNCSCFQKPEYKGGYVSDSDDDDDHFRGRRRHKSHKEDKITKEQRAQMELSTILTLFEGIQELNGAIIIMTTNNEEKIHDAIKRPGRIEGGKRNFIGKLPGSHVVNYFHQRFGCFPRYKSVIYEHSFTLAEVISWFDGDVSAHEVDKNIESSLMNFIDIPKISSHCLEGET